MEEGHVAVGERPGRRQQRSEEAEEPPRREDDGEDHDPRTGGASAKDIRREATAVTANGRYFCGQRTKNPSAQMMSWS